MAKISGAVVVLLLLGVAGAYYWFYYRPAHTSGTEQSLRKAINMPSGKDGKSTELDSLIKNAVGAKSARSYATVRGRLPKLVKSRSI